MMGRLREGLQRMMGKRSHGEIEELRGKAAEASAEWRRVNGRAGTVLRRLDAEAPIRHPHR